MSAKRENNSILACTGAVITLLLYVIAFIIAGKMFGDEFGEFFKWWACLLALGIIYLPASLLIFNDFKDCGFLFSKVIGIAFSGFLSWFLASIKLVPFTGMGTFITVIIGLILNVIVLIVCRRKRQMLFSERFTIKSRLYSVLYIELFFLVLLIGWLYLKGYRPEAYGTTEKIMDYGFMLSLDKSPYMPATDMWLSGENFNYYYVGQYIATYLSKLSGVGVGYGYNFMLMSEAAFAFVIPFSLVVTVVRDRMEDLKITSKAKLYSIPYIAGLISGIAVDFCGNLHYIVFNNIVPALQDMLGVTELAQNSGTAVSGYWFPNSTRYIGYVPDTADKTIHEFPSYSFVLGDLHAHVINICFVLTVVGILYAYMRYRKKSLDSARQQCLFIEKSDAGDAYFGIPSFFKEVFNPCVIAIGFFIGLFHMTNYWDYPIYFVVAGAVLLFTNCIVYNFSWLTVKLTFFHAAVVLIISQLVCMPFTLNFDQISTRIRLAESHTPLYQYMILWGLPLITAIVFVVGLIIEKKKAGLFVKDEVATPGRQNRLFRFIGSIDSGDLFMVILVLCAIGLTLLPEVIYVEDIYSGDYKRANTMFKLTYQAFILFGTAFGYIITRLVFFSKKVSKVIFGVIVFVILMQSAGYVCNASESWFLGGNREYVGLDSSLYMQQVNVDDWNTIEYINNNIEGRPVILEVNGGSYTDYNRISAWTGCPTLLGWQTHEWLWRSTGAFEMPGVIVERGGDIKKIYTGTDTDEVEKLIEYYDIEYIYVGDLEKSDFGDNLNYSIFEELCDIAFESGGSRLYKVK